MSAAFKRLIICLDGTWNNRDSSTNVFHLYNLLADVDANGVRQLRYYDEGVGTGILDKMTGGMFGIGLDENVIQAYEWLIEQYEDGDEVYVFGFSRGAFTARSLGGFLMKCGLLRRGAPLTVEQLWAGYRVLGRRRDSKNAPTKSTWRKIIGQEYRPYRSIVDLKWDTGHVKVTDPNPTEKLLIEWTRRIPIHCIGVFDTVGAMGLDALCIPGLHSEEAAFHNTNPSKLIKHGYHALAIDEHRINFQPVLWRRYVPKGSAPDADPWETYEQRWFTGAHANVGGGYGDNPLCLFPLDWMMRRTAALGLAFLRQPALPAIADCVPLLKSADGYKPFLRDSYAEFFGGFLKLITLGRAYYRTIAGPPLVNSRYTLQSLNEVIDESVGQFMGADPTYRPKNLPKPTPQAQT